jgi:hypothetical protein
VEDLDNVQPLRLSRKVTKMIPSRQQRSTSVSAHQAQADTTLRLRSVAMRRHLASVVGAAYPTNTPKSEVDGTTAMMTDTVPVLGATRIANMQAEEMTALDDETIATDHATILVTTVGLVAPTG